MLREFFRRYKLFRAPGTYAEREERSNFIVWTVLKIIVLIDIAFIIVGMFGQEAAFFWSLFFAFLFFNWDSRYVGALAILALTACPILLALELKADAEQMAVWAYYFLVMTVVLQIIEYKREGRAVKLHVKSEKNGDVV